MAQAKWPRGALRGSWAMAAAGGRSRLVEAARPADVWAAARRDRRRRAKDAVEGRLLAAYCRVEDLETELTAERQVNEIARFGYTKIMEGIKDAPPIPRGELDPRVGRRGYKEVFNPTTMAADLKAAGTSEMAGNFFWQNKKPFVQQRNALVPGETNNRP